jgi:ferrous iron transport protein B
MVVVVFMAAALFGEAAPLVAWGLVILNLALLAVVGIFFDRLVLHSVRPALIVELPLYHLPNWRAIALETWASVREFLARAGTIILAVSVLVWVLAELPTGRIDESYLAALGRRLEGPGGLMGLDWRMMVALLASIVAKENALATMAVLSASGQESNLAAALPQMMSPASALAYLVMLTTFVPCASTVTAIQRETGSWRWTAVTVAYLLALSLAAGTVTYQAARLLGWGL